MTSKQKPGKIEQTLAIIKPDGIALMGQIITILQTNFDICRMELIRFSPEGAGSFYSEHKGQPFFDRLVKFMSSGPSLVMVLQGPDAIARYRKLMGPTDPAKAKKLEEFTLRKGFGTDMPKNAVHGSDGPESAEREINYFFPR